MFTWVTSTRIFTVVLADWSSFVIFDIINFGREEVGVVECLVAVDLQTRLSQKDVETWGNTCWYFWKASSDRKDDNVCGGGNTCLLFHLIVLFRELLRHKACLKSEFGLMSKLIFDKHLVFQWWSPLHPCPSPMQYQWCHKNPAIQKLIQLESHNGMMHERKFITVKFWKVGFYLSSLWQTNWSNCNRRFSIGRFNFLLKFQNCNIMAFVVIGLKTTFWWSQPIWWYLMMN